jgi:hypothetical protein
MRVARKHALIRKHPHPESETRIKVRCPVPAFLLSSCMLTCKRSLSLSETYAPSAAIHAHTMVRTAAGMHPSTCQMSSDHFARQNACLHWYFRTLYTPLQFSIRGAHDSWSWMSVGNKLTRRWTQHDRGSTPFSPILPRIFGRTTTVLLSRYCSNSP